MTAPFRPLDGMRAIRDDRDLDSTAKLVALALVLRIDKSGVGRVSYPVLARDAGLGLRAVKSAVSRLLKHSGFFSVELVERGSNITHVANLYRVRITRPAEAETERDDAPEASAPDAPAQGGLVHDVHQASAPDALGVVHQMHQASAPDAPYLPSSASDLPTTALRGADAPRAADATLPLPGLGDVQPEKEMPSEPKRKSGKTKKGKEHPSKTHQLRDHYFASFKRAKGCQPGWGDNGWSRAMGAFKSILQAVGDDMAEAEAVITRYFAVPRNLAWCEPWTIASQTNSYRGTMPPQKGGPRVQRSDSETPDDELFERYGEVRRLNAAAAND